MQNDRKYIRVEIDSISNIKRQAVSRQFENELKAKVLNISMGGIYIETNQPLPEGTLFEFEFKLPDSNKIVKSKGIVTWVTKKNNQSSMGIKFIKVSTNDKKAIIAYIESRLIEKGISFEEFGDGSTPIITKKGFEGLIEDELHQRFLRIYFKEIGFDMGIEEVKEKLACSEDEFKVLIKTFEKAGIINSEKDRVNFFYSEDQKLRNQIENWIRENVI